MKKLAVLLSMILAVSAVCPVLADDTIVTEHGVVLDGSYIDGDFIETIVEENEIDNVYYVSEENFENEIYGGDSGNNTIYTEKNVIIKDSVVSGNVLITYVEQNGINNIYYIIKSPEKEETESRSSRRSSGGGGGRSHYVGGSSSSSGGSSGGSSKGSSGSSGSSKQAEAVTETTTEDVYYDYEEAYDEEFSPKRIDVTAGENQIYLNGQAHYMDSPAYIKNGSMMIPLRAVTQILENADITYDAVCKEAAIAYKGNTIRYTAGALNYYKNNARLPLIAGIAEITNGRMYVPLRNLGTGFDLVVTYDPNSKTAELTEY